MDSAQLTPEEKQFLQMVNDPKHRQALLTRLEQLGLLASFLESKAPIPTRQD